MPLFDSWTAEGEELVLFANSKDMQGSANAKSSEVAAFASLVEKRHASAASAQVGITRAAPLAGKEEDWNCETHRDLASSSFPLTPPTFLRLYV